MNVIADILRQKPEQYSIEIFKIFSMWCELNSMSRKEHQAMVCNQKLYNWFLTKVKSLELVFFDQIGHNHNQLTIKEKYEIFK